MRAGQGMLESVAQIKQPNWRTGFNIFMTRPLSLVVALIFAIIICLASFMLLAFPVVAGYYYAIGNSKREEFFIDLPNVLRTTSLVTSGMGKYLIPSYIVGFLGLVPALILFLAPVLPASLLGDNWTYVSIPLMILWLPAFFLMGVTIFNAYPKLITTADGIGAIRYAVSVGKANRLLAVARGFVLLCPIPGWIIHFLMVFSYPIITAWAVSATGDTTEEWYEAQASFRSLWVGVATGLVLSGILVGFCFLFVSLWEIAGFVGWLVLSFISVFIWARRYNVPKY